MKIHGKKLKTAMTLKGVDAPSLAAALAAPGFSAADAERAITNWLDDRDHPRCKPVHIRMMAQTLGVRIADIVKFTSSIRNHRGSPRKAKLLTDLIRGKRVSDAQNQLTFTTKKAAVNVKRCLQAALTDAVSLGEVDTDKLVVSEARVDQGTVMKRFQPKDRGRAHAIHKFFSHIVVSVEEKSK